MNKISQQNKILILSFLVFLGIYYFINKKSASIPVAEKKEVVVADTFIPRGYVLVPISIDPSSQISGLIDQFAIVDLYAPDKDLHANVLIASGVKLIRAPLNPQQFAVLVTEVVSHEIMKITSPFWVTLQNRSKPAPLPPGNTIAAPTRPEAPVSMVTPKPVLRAPLKIEYFKGI